MNKQFWISGVAVGLGSLVLGFVVHALLLHEDYAKLAHLFRSESDAQRFFPFMLLAHLLTGFGLTWMYRRGARRETGVLGPGMSFGAAAALLITVPIYLIYYAVQPMPGAVVTKQILFDMIGVVLLGILVALLNRPPEPA